MELRYCFIPYEVFFSEIKVVHMYYWKYESIRNSQLTGRRKVFVIEKNFNEHKLKRACIKKKPIKYEMFSPHNAKWGIPKLILKACTIIFNALNYIYIF